MKMFIGLEFDGSVEDLCGALHKVTMEARNTLYVYANHGCDASHSCHSFKQHEFEFLPDDAVDGFGLSDFVDYVRPVVDCGEVPNG